MAVPRVIGYWKMEDIRLRQGYGAIRPLAKKIEDRKQEIG